MATKKKRKTGNVNDTSAKKHESNAKSKRALAKTVKSPQLKRLLTADAGYDEAMAKKKKEKKTWVSSRNKPTMGTLATNKSKQTSKNAKSTVAAAKKKAKGKVVKAKAKPTTRKLVKQVRKPLKKRGKQ
jgi:hypothetical protein